MGSNHRDKVFISIFISVSVEVYQGEGSTTSVGVLPNCKKKKLGEESADP